MLAEREKDKKSTYRPCSSNGQVEDDIHWGVRQSGPDTRVAHLSSCESVEERAIHEPLDCLGLPVVGSTVDLEGPGVELVVLWNGNALSKARGLVASTTTNVVTVGSAVARQLAIDLLKDVELSAKRPGSAGAHRLTQHPKGRPHALLLVDVAAAASKSSLDLHDSPRCRGPGLNRLNTRRGPLPLGRLLRNELEGLATRQLHVGAGLSVSLELLVVVDVGDDVPLGQIDHAALFTDKGLLPDHVHALNIGGESSSGGQGQGEDGKRLKEHLAWVSIKGLYGFLVAQQKCERRPVLGLKGIVRISDEVSR